MGKIIRCRDVGFNCDGVIKAPTEQEALAMAAQHAMTVHNVKEVTPEMVKKIKEVMKEG